MTNYYFLKTFLPPLSFEEKPEISFSELMDLFAINLRPHDYEKALVVQRYIDLYNMRNFWLGTQLDERGLVSKEYIETSQSTMTGLPEYTLDFLQHFEKGEERAKHFASLLGAYFQEEEERASGFLKKYLRFEREWRLVMTFLRAKRLKRDIRKELSFEDFSDPFVDEILTHEEVPLGFEEVQAIDELYHDAPLELLKEVLKFRFMKIEEMKGDKPFSFDQLMGYATQLLLIERWQEANKEISEELIEGIIKAAK